MRWTRTSFVVALVVSLSGCGDAATSVAGASLAVEAADVATTPSSSSSSYVEPSTSTPAITIPAQVDEGRRTDLMPIFDLLGERTWALQAIGYDEATDRYVVYTKNGEGFPVVHDAPEPPTLRTPSVLVDDGGGRVPGEAHSIVRSSPHSFDVYWTSHEVTEVQSLRSGADPLMGRDARRLHSAVGGRVVFEDITPGVETGRGPLLRSHRAGTTGQFAEDWTVQLDAEILFVVDVGSERMLVATAARGSSEATIDRLHLVEDDGFVRSMSAPTGLLWIQLPGEGLDTHDTCSNERLGMASTGTNGVDWWEVDATHQLLTACSGGTPISTTVWCCGMGEFYGAIDSNDDGVEEVFVGGTSAGGGGGGMYSLVDDDLAAIRTDGGEELHLFSGDVGNSFGKYGCRDGLFVQVEVMAEGDTASATRTFYRIEGHSAAVVDVERIEWRLDASAPRDLSVWDVYDTAPEEIVNDLLPCESPRNR